VRDHIRSGTSVVDGMRGIAIVLVLVFHTWLFSWYTPELRLFGVQIPVDVIPRTGYLGVDLFFVISGFVLFFPHAVRAIAGAGETHGPAAFAKRRIIKIVPSYALAFAVTAIAMVSLNRPFDLGAAVLQHAFFVNNFFDDRMGFANSVFWSLAIEAQFYAIFLPIAWLFRRFPIVVAALMIGIAIVYRVETSHHYLTFEPIYRQLPAFLDVFAAGMFAAYAVVWVRTHLHDSILWRTAFTLGAFAGLTTIWLFLASANTIQYDPGGPERWDIYNRTYLAWSFALCAACSCLAFPLWRALIANRVLVFFSLISYNLYLWHALVMIWLWKGDRLAHVTKEPHSDDHWKLVFIAISWPAAIAIATALTYFLERPLMSLVSPQTFAFDWSRVARAMRRRSSSASAETPS
jgi:peptidoglycan/LPS O-acetylase OafA/YrhL